MNDETVKFGKVLATGVPTSVFLLMAGTFGYWAGLLSTTTPGWSVFVSALGSFAFGLFVISPVLLLITIKALLVSYFSVCLLLGILLGVMRGGGL